jgi:hypothetical protein
LSTTKVLYTIDGLYNTELSVWGWTASGIASSTHFINFNFDKEVVLTLDLMKEMMDRVNRVLYLFTQPGVYMSDGSKEPIIKSEVDGSLRWSTEQGTSCYTSKIEAINDQRYTLDFKHTGDPGLEGYQEMKSLMNDLMGLCITQKRRYYPSRFTER